MVASVSPSSTAGGDASPNTGAGGDASSNAGDASSSADVAATQTTADTDPTTAHQNNATDVNTTTAEAEGNVIHDN